MPLTHNGSHIVATLPIEGSDDNLPVHLIERDGKLYVRCYNEGGFNWTDLDAAAFIDWVVRHYPLLVERPLYASLNQRFASPNVDAARCATIEAR